VRYILNKRYKADYER